MIQTTSPFIVHIFEILLYAYTNRKLMVQWLAQADHNLEIYILNA